MLWAACLRGSWPCGYVCVWDGWYRCNNGDSACIWYNRISWYLSFWEMSLVVLSSTLSQNQWQISCLACHSVYPTLANRSSPIRGKVWENVGSGHWLVLTRSRRQLVLAPHIPHEATVFAYLESDVLFMHLVAGFSAHGIFKHSMIGTQASKQLLLFSFWLAHRMSEADRQSPAVCVTFPAADMMDMATGRE